jgi:hypothetical protein
MSYSVVVVEHVGFMCPKSFYTSPIFGKTTGIVCVFTIPRPLSCVLFRFNFFTLCSKFTSESVSCTPLPPLGLGEMLGLKGGPRQEPAGWWDHAGGQDEVQG